MGASARGSFYEVVYFLPVTSTLIAMATVWQFLLHPRSARSTALLRWLGFAEVAFPQRSGLRLCRRWP